VKGEIAMNAWKKIASLGGMSLAALFGAACTAEVEQPAEPADTSAELAAADGPEGTPLAASLERNSHCEHQCYREYMKCMRAADRPAEEAHCRRDYKQCMRQCDHGH
jgi:hypothetical protein